MSRTRQSRNKRASQIGRKARYLADHLNRGGMRGADWYHGALEAVGADVFFDERATRKLDPQGASDVYVLSDAGRTVEVTYEPSRDEWVVDTQVLGSSRRSRLTRRGKEAASAKWMTALTKHSDAAASYAQKKLRKEPALTAHRVSEGSGCEKVTVKADRRRAEVHIGVDACTIDSMKHVCSVYVGGEEVKKAEFPIDMEEADLGDKAADLLLAELQLAAPESPEEDFGAERVASFSRKTKRR